MVVIYIIVYDGIVFSILLCTGIMEIFMVLIIIGTRYIMALIGIDLFGEIDITVNHIIMDMDTITIMATTMAIITIGITAIEG